MLNTYPCNPFPQSTEQAGAGGSTAGGVAENITYDNTSSGLAADDVQAAIDELAGDLTAENITYDNTSSGLAADDVQAAIDELADRAFSISSTESIVAKYDNKDLYARTFTVETLPNNTTLNITSTELNNCRVVYILGAAYSKSTPDTEIRPIPFAGLGNNDIRVEVTSGKLTIQTGADWSTFSAEITVFYTKNTL